MVQRLEFVLQAIKHETNMAELCRNFGISRQTGYELVAHFKSDGLDGVKAHSRAPRTHPNAIAQEVCAAVIRAKARHPNWGPKKLQPPWPTSPRRSNSTGPWPAHGARSWRGLGWW
jgi:hypothetical protein